MRIVSLVLRLAVVGVAITSLGHTDVAWAQSGPVFEGAGLIEVVPPNGVIGDGASAASVYLLALNADGTAMTGVKWKAAPASGSAGDFVEVGGGLYRFTYTGPKVDQVTAVNLTIKGKVGKENVQKSFSLMVAPPVTHTVAIAANPALLTLGQDKTATLSINLSGGDRNALGIADIKVVASTGSVSNVTNLGGGQFSALYTAPTTINYPHVAMVSLIDRADPSRTYGTLSIPLGAKVDYPVTVGPNARVIMKVAGQQFGPIQADAQGRARVPVIVPPGVTQGEVVQIDVNNQSTSQAIDLKVPESRRIALLPSATSIPSDNRLQIPIRAVVNTPDGKPDGNANVVFTTTAGTISAPKHEGNGVYVATYTPPTGNVAAQATVSVALSEKPTTQADTTPLSLVPVHATKLVLSSEPSTLSAAANEVKVFAKVSGPDGAGLGSRTVTLSANGARQKDAVKDLRNGDYQAVFSTTGNGAVEVMATVGATVTGNPLSRVVAMASRGRLPPDGLSNTAVVMMTVDEFGYPVPNVPVTLRLATGDGALPTQATTNAEGMAVVYYTAGRKNQLVNIEVNANGKMASASVLQAPTTVAAPAIPSSGTKAEIDLATELAAGVGALRVEREGQTGMTAPVAVPTLAMGRASRASLASEPASAAPGGMVKLRIRLTDDAGNGIGGQSLDFLTSAGSVSAVNDLGGGLYEAQLLVPTNATADVKVSVATSDGGASSFMKVPLGGAESAWVTAVPAPGPAAAPVAAPTAAKTEVTVGDPFGAPVAAAPPVTTAMPTTTPAPVTSVTPTASVAKVVKPVSPDSRPWLRVDIGGEVGSYYVNQVQTNASPLFDDPFEVTTSTGGPVLQVRAFVPTFKYVGMEVGGSLSYWAIDAGGFCASLGTCEGGTLDDFNRAYRLLGIARYPFDVGNNRYSVGLRVGGVWSDSPYVQIAGNGDGAKTLGIAHDTLVGGLGLGVEVGAEVGEHFFALANITEGFAGVSAPYDTRLGLDLGWAFTEHFYASLGVDGSVRSLDLDVDGTKVGQIDDTLVTGSLALGLQY